MSVENHRLLEGVLHRKGATLLRISGEDALAFLQGQFTQELRPDRAPAVNYGLWLNQKGRVLADSHVLRFGDGAFALSSDESPAATLRERLDAYIIADDVVIDDESEAKETWVLAGNAAANWFRESGVEPPGVGELAAVRGGWAFAGRVPGTWTWIGPHEDAPQNQAQLEWAELERARILAGIPAVPREIGPGDLAAEGGLEESAISFTKGCYLGQEVVVRLNSMGRLRRRLMRIEAATGESPTVPAAIHQDGRQIGELRSAVVHEAGWIGLAMMQLTGLRTDAPASLAADGDGVLRVTEIGRRA